MRLLTDLARLRPEDFDARLRLPGVERLHASDAVVVNLDYPLGLGAYHILLQLAESMRQQHQ